MIVTLLLKGLARALMLMTLQQLMKPALLLSTGAKSSTSWQALFWAVSLLLIPQLLLSGPSA